MRAKTTNAIRKLVASWTDDIKVGIYDSKWSVRLYENRALLTMPTVKWVGTSGGYAEVKSRITGRDLASHAKRPSSDLLWDLSRYGDARTPGKRHRIPKWVAARNPWSQPETPRMVLGEDLG